MSDRPLSRLFVALSTAVVKHESKTHDKKISVNPVISKFASWYEKLRNAMDYRDEEVILRAAIERILKRRLILHKNGEKIAAPLIRELVWARYFPENSVPESLIEKVQERILLYLRLRTRILLVHKKREAELGEWLLHVLSSDIEKLLHPAHEKEIMSGFMYQIMREQVTLTDESEQTRDAQVFIAVRRCFAKDDNAFLRFHLFNQYFGILATDNGERIAASFFEGFEEIQKQLHHPRQEHIYGYIRRKTAVFFILEDILTAHETDSVSFVQKETELKEAVYAYCQKRYDSVRIRVARAVMRSVAFIFLTKVFFAFAVEGTLERLLYGKIFWHAIALNTLMPPILMILVSFFIQTPKQDNSERILSYLRAVIFYDRPTLGNPLVVKSSGNEQSPIFTAIFSFLWLLAFVIAFGVIIFVSHAFGMHPVSQAIFLFFLAIVSFLSYRISLIPLAYMVDEKQNFVTPIVDFFFMPVIRVGRRFTEGISQINVVLYFFDMVIETPFKALFAFAEQWFLFLHAKREGLE